MITRENIEKVAGFMLENKIETAVLEGREYQIGYTSEFWYIDKYDDEFERFEPLLECETLQELKERI